MSDHDLRMRSAWHVAVMNIVLLFITVIMTVTIGFTLGQIGVPGIVLAVFFIPCAGIVLGSCLLWLLQYVHHFPEWTFLPLIIASHMLYGYITGLLWPLQFDSEKREYKGYLARFAVPTVITAIAGASLLFFMQDS